MTLQLPSHVLADIFRRLSLEQKLCVLPCVCHAWRKVCEEDPGCWEGKVDLRDFVSSFSMETDQEKLHRLARLLVTKLNRGHVSHFTVPFLSAADMLLDTSTSGSSLQVLQIPQNNLSEDILYQLAAKFTSLTSLDLSGALNLSDACVEVFGKNCPQIAHLKLNMNPQIECVPNDGIAFAVGNTMHQLEHLEMAYGTLSNAGFKFLMEMCAKLEFLDLRGCWHVDMSETYAKEAIQRLKVFHRPIVIDDIYDDESYAYLSEYEDYANEPESCSGDYASESEYCYSDESEYC